MAARASPQLHQRGFTYLILLFALAIFAASSAVLGIIWHTHRQREKEAELLLIGHEFRKAVALYYARNTESAHPYPTQLTDLLSDPRQLSIQRYLRKIYRDPLTGKAEWGFVPAPQGGIMGVYSLSPDHPLKTGNFSDADKSFEGKTSYSDWQFVYLPPGHPVPSVSRYPVRQ